MKILRLAIMITIAFTLMIVFTSCGKDNKVDSSPKQSYTPPLSSSPGTSSGIMAIVADIKSQTDAMGLPCTQGGSRIDVNYNTNSLASSSTIAAVGLDQSAPLTGSISDVYIGRTAFNDVMTICKMADGRFNITLSMCPWSYQNVPYITTTRSIGKFTAKQGITLADKTYNNLGTVLAAKETYLYLGPLDNIPNSETWFGPTTFTDVTIQQ